MIRMDFDSLIAEVLQNAEAQLAETSADHERIREDRAEDVPTPTVEMEF